MARTTQNSKKRQAQIEEKESQMEVDEPSTQIEMVVADNSREVCIQLTNLEDILIS